MTTDVVDMFGGPLGNSNELDINALRPELIANVPSMTDLEERPRRRLWVRLLLPYVYLFVIGLLAATVHIVQYRTFSPIDELRHVDYAIRASKLQVPRYGDLLIDESMREEACRGVDLGGWTDPPCDSRVFDPAAFRDDGYQIASIHPPPYYLATGLVARAARFVGLTDSFLDPARMFSALLLAIGLMVAFAAGRLLGVGTTPLLAALTFLPAMPAVLHSASTVNPDSTAILVGSVVLLVALLWERGRVPTYVLPFLGVLSTALKFTSALAAIIVAAVFLVRAEPVELWRRWRRSTEADASRERGGVERVRSRREYLTASMLLLGGAAVIALAWSGIDRMRRIVDPIEVPQVRTSLADGIPSPGFLLSWQQLFAWLPPADGYEPARFLTVGTTDVRVLATFLFAGAVLMAALRVNQRDDISLLGGSCVAAALIGGPTYVAMNAVIQDIRLVLPPRYGMSLLPIMVPVLGSFAKGRAGVTLLWIASSVSYVVVVGTMVSR